MAGWELERQFRESDNMGNLSTTLTLWILSVVAAIIGAILGVIWVVKPKSSILKRSIGFAVFVAAAVAFFYLVETFPIEINSIEIRPE